MANSVDSDHMPQNVVSDRGLYYWPFIQHWVYTVCSGLSVLIFRVITVGENSFACQIPTEGNMENSRYPVWLTRTSEEIPKISSLKLYAILFRLISVFMHLIHKILGGIVNCVDLDKEQSDLDLHCSKLHMPFHQIGWYTIL